MNFRAWPLQRRPESATRSPAAALLQAAVSPQPTQQAAVFVAYPSRAFIATAASCRHTQGTTNSRGIPAPRAHALRPACLGAPDHPARRAAHGLAPARPPGRGGLLRRSRSSCGRVSRGGHPRAPAQHPRLRLGRRVARRSCGVPGPASGRFAFRRRRAFAAATHALRWPRRRPAACCNRFCHGADCCKQGSVGRGEPALNGRRARRGRTRRAAGLKHCVADLRQRKRRWARRSSVCRVLGTGHAARRKPRGAGCRGRARRPSAPNAPTLCMFSLIWTRHARIALSRVVASSRSASIGRTRSPSCEALVSSCFGSHKYTALLKHWTRRKGATLPTAEATASSGLAQAPRGTAALAFAPRHTRPTRPGCPARAPPPTRPESNSSELAPPSPRPSSRQIRPVLRRRCWKQDPFRAD